VVKKVDVKHSFNWDNDFVSKYYHGHLNKIWTCRCDWNIDLMFNFLWCQHEAFWLRNGMMLELEWCNCKIERIILFLGKGNQ
jgi:hypothetical protein